MRLIGLMLILALFLCGCAAFRAAITDIKEDPAAFTEEAKGIASDIDKVSPIQPGAIGLVIGYAMAFLRRVYVNWRKEKDLAISELKASVDRG